LTRERKTRFGCGPEFERLVTWPLEFAGEKVLFANVKSWRRNRRMSGEDAALLALAKSMACGGGQKAEGKEFTATNAVRKMGEQCSPREGTPERELRDAIPIELPSWVSHSFWPSTLVNFCCPGRSVS